MTLFPKSTQNLWNWPFLSFLISCSTVASQTCSFRTSSLTHMTLISPSSPSSPTGKKRASNAGAIWTLKGLKKSVCVCVLVWWRQALNWHGIILPTHVRYRWPNNRKCPACVALMAVWASSWRRTFVKHVSLDYVTLRRREHVTWKPYPFFTDSFLNKNVKVKHPGEILHPVWIATLINLFCS